ncbi:MAG: lytic transglycosylase domain-containing protein [Rubrivivax sp.]|nr:lytic transglycosylase domain-containing protein [Rubrivivax sp.]
MGAGSLVAALLGATLPAQAQPRPAATAGDELVLQAREALRANDRTRLAALTQRLQDAGHPLAMWADYWRLSSGLAQAQQADLDAFYARWGGSYVEDRLRNDWLLELGKRRDWAGVRAEFPRFRMNDDREVTCYMLLARHDAGDLGRTSLREQALAAWLAQRDVDDGCQLLAQTLTEARVLSAADAWARARQAAETNRPRALRAAAALVSPAAAQGAAAMLDNPARYLTRLPVTPDATQRELALLALMRVAAGDPEVAATQLQTGWARRLRPEQAATAWAQVARQSALRLQPQAVAHAQRAWQQWERALEGTSPPWSDDALAWQVRAALRQPEPDRDWALVQRAIAAMSPAEQRDEAWVYWGAKAAQALAPRGPAGAPARAEAGERLLGIAGRLSFYGKLATEALEQRFELPTPAAALQDAEREAAATHPGLTRALQLLALGLRSEGVREWNFSLRGLGERELLAAAQRACDQAVWDRCINTSDRTRTEIALAQRFPTPFRDEVVAKAREIGLDPALMYGLIRQESRFITDARSHVGASGLMQLMPATARWTARKVGLPFTPGMINDPQVNLHLGASYLKLVLDDFDGSLAMATAAYNAGPGRPRRWREVSTVEAAAWAEGIPFNETRDYVKKVLSNQVFYSAILGGEMPSLSALLGPPIGPRDPATRPPDRELP